LAFAARVRELALRDKSYRATPVGGMVGRYMRSLKWSEKSQNTLDTYEIPLSRLSLDFAHYESLEEFTAEAVRDFLDEHWGEASAATRANRLAAVRSFFSWCVVEGRLSSSPAGTIKTPRVRNRERNAYKPDIVHDLIKAQPTMRDQIALALLGRLALRRNELRLLRLRDFDLSAGTVLIHGKGSKQVVLPIGFERLRADLELHLLERPNHEEYLLYARERRLEPMHDASVHRWFKLCLERAGLPTSMQMHEMRHSAADHLWRQTGNLILAQKLLRHESPATTATYLHPNRDDLAAALRSLEDFTG
jgi:integrase/recombinase XerC